MAPRTVSAMINVIQMVLVDIIPCSSQAFVTW